MNVIQFLENPLSPDLSRLSINFISFKSGKTIFSTKKKPNIMIVDDGSEIIFISIILENEILVFLHLPIVIWPK